MYGKEIKEARINFGMTQTAVSKKTGIPQNTISWIEADKGIANIQQCVLLADLYEISIDELIGRIYKQNKQKNINQTIQDNHGKIINKF